MTRLLSSERRPRRSIEGAVLEVSAARQAEKRGEWRATGKRGELVRVAWREVVIRGNRARRAVGVLLGQIEEGNIMRNDSFGLVREERGCAPVCLVQTDRQTDR